MSDLAKKAVKSASEFNSQLNQDRKDRKVCMDLQNYIVHYPVGLGKDNKGLKRARRPAPGKYPVALLPGHFQDWYLKYTPQELKYLPLNTVLYGPVVSDLSKLPPLSQEVDGSQSDSDCDSIASEDSSCSSSEHGTQGTSSGSAEEDCEAVETPKRARKKLNGISNGGICKVCKGDAHRNKLNKAEDLLVCSECKSSAHPSCLELTDEMITMVRSYSWQCMDCKTCVKCGKPHDEDKMMFCDNCDRGYHTFCVGLKNLPHGRWVCLLCSHCAQCGSKTPGHDNNPKVHWQHEVIKIYSPNGETLTRHQVLCQSCHKHRKR